jgi:uncharacterized phage protein (TIGR02220 family)
MTSGYIKLFRSVFDNKLWESEPFTRAQAWIDLFGKANFEEGTIFVRGIEVIIGKGETCRSEESLAKTWKWSRGKVRRFLEFLEKESMIERKQYNKIGIITICNYCRFNSDENKNDTTNSTTKSQQTDDKQYPIKKKEKNKKNKESIVWVVNYLNKICNTNYKDTSKKTSSLIIARINEGFNGEDFKSVIDKKHSEWHGTEHEKYLRPETLFGSKFEGYLNQKIKSNTSDMCV